MARKTPRALQEQLKRAEEMHKEAYSQGEEGQNQDPQQDSEPQQQQDPEPQQQQQDPEPQQDPEAQQDPEPQPQQDPEPWEQRYKTLQGRYNKEVPALHRQVNELDRKVTELEDALYYKDKELTELKAQKQQPSSGPDNSLVTKEEIEEYGEDFVSFTQRIAREAAQRETENLRPQIDQIRGEVQKTGQQSAMGRVYEALDQNVPGWKTINKDAAFLGWLAEEDPLSGRTRRELLSEAFQNAQAQRVVGVFRTYVQESGGAQKPQQKPSLEQFAGPARATPTQAPTEPAQPKIWKREDIAAFYRDVQRGKITGEAREAKERDLALAMREGRIE